METPSQTSALSKDLFTDMVMGEAMKDKEIMIREQLKNQGKAWVKLIDIAI